MTSTRRLLLIVFLSSAAFGQRSGGFRRSAGSIMGQTAPGPSVHIRALPGTTRGGRLASGFGPSGYRTGSHYGRGYGLYTSHIPLSGYGLYAPYSPSYGDDQFGAEYPQQDPAASNLPITRPNLAESAGPIPPEHATSVIHEYKFGKQAAGTAGERQTFTIVLNDGSKHSAVASWVKDGKLHYLDLHSRQQFLSSKVIDRDATQRANEQNNLNMDLPPG